MNVEEPCGDVGSAVWSHTRVSSGNPQIVGECASGIGRARQGRRDAAGDGGRGGRRGSGRRDY